MGVAVIVVIAVFFLGMGIYALAAPAALIRPFGVNLESPTSRSEVRAVYGGFGLAITPSGRAFVTGGYNLTTFGLHTTLVEELDVTDVQTAGVGGPYTVAVGGSVQVNGSGADPEGGALSFAWDLNNDLVYETNPPAGDKVVPKGVNSHMFGPEWLLGKTPDPDKKTPAP